MAEKAYITPEVLKWARESARMPVEIACRKVSVTVEKLESWEDGSAQPTINQAETLAKVYKRPFAVFFLPNVPRDFTLLQDFRAKTSAPLGTGAIFIMREIQQKQQWLRELYEDNKEQPLPFVGRFTVASKPHEVAADILATLSINPAAYATNAPLREWINKAEAKGICVSRTSFIHSNLKLDSEEFQGFVIADNLAPFVFVNSDDWDAPQLFTLVHELAHIWIAESGVTNVPRPGAELKDRFHPTEMFCNEVAANALMPASIMQGLARDALNSYDGIRQAAKRIGVSTLAMLVRSLKMSLLSLETYTKHKKQAEAEFRAFEKLEAEKKAKQKAAGKKGGPNYYTLQLGKNGKLFTQIVIDAFNGGVIPPTKASNLLNVQVSKFSVYDSIIHQ